MEDSPGLDAWTTVGKKATKKKTRDGSQHGEGSRGQAPSSQPADRKKKESTGSRPERGGGGGGDRRNQGDRDRRSQQQGDRGGGGRRPPSGRGGSAQRNTLPRRPQDGRGGGNQRGGVSGGAGGERRQQNTASANPWETWTPATQTTSVTSSASNSPRKQSWANLVDRSTSAPRETSATPPPTTSTSTTVSTTTTAESSTDSGSSSGKSDKNVPNSNVSHTQTNSANKTSTNTRHNEDSSISQSSSSSPPAGSKSGDKPAKSSPPVKTVEDGKSNLENSSTSVSTPSSTSTDTVTNQQSDQATTNPEKAQLDKVSDSAAAPAVHEVIDKDETERDAINLVNSRETESANDIPTEIKKCDKSNANHSVTGSNTDLEPDSKDSSNQVTTNSVPTDKPNTDVKSETTDTSSQPVDTKLDNKTYENLDNDQNGLRMKIDKDIKESIDANGNNVSLDSNKNKLVKGVSPSMEDVLIKIDPDTRQYDRDILLMLQKHPLSLQKPDKLPELEIVLNAPMRNSASAPLLGDKPASNFVRPGLPTKRDSKRREPKKVISISREPVVLRTSNNAWKAKKESSDFDKLASRIRAILNKLTPTNFQTLVVQFKELEINTEDQIVLAMELVFEKAVEEPAYSKNYASLCKELSIKRVTKEGTDQVLDFRSLLLERCRTEFQKDYISPEDRKNYEEGMKNSASEEEKRKIKEEFGQLESKMRKRSLGNIRFVGELYMQDLLRQGIVHNHIIMKLLNNVDEESMECLCRFLTTCGAKLEADAVHIPQEHREKASLSKYFTRIQTIIDERKTSSRVRFMLQDLVELKANRWVSLRRKETGPKTIDEIKKEAKYEELKIQLADSQLDQPVSRRSEEKARRKTEYRPKPVVNEEGWNNVPTKAAKMSLDMDPEKLRSIKKVDVDNMRLGGGFTSWGMGSSGAKSGGGGGAGGHTKTIINRYQLLEDDDQPAPAATSTSHLYAGRASEPVIRSVDRSSSRANASFEQARGSASDEGRDSPLRETRSPSADTSRNVLRGPDTADTEALRSKFKLLLQEYLSNCDFKETLNSICEMFSQSNIGILVEETINYGLELINPGDRAACGRLLVGLVKQQVLNSQAIVSGVSMLLEIAEDLLIDIPKFWEFLADILVIIVLDTDFFNTLVEGCCGCLPDTKLREKFISTILHAVQSRDEDKFSTYLTASRQVLESALSQNLDDFLQQNKFSSEKKTESGLVTVKESGANLVNGSLQESLHRQLANLFEKGNTGNEEMSGVDTILCDKVLDSETIRTLVFTVMESVVKGGHGEACSLQKDLLLERLPILKKYIDANKDRELYAMFALQSLVHKLEHPHKLLHEILEIMYDNEVISDEGIFDWEKNEDVEEQEGKGVAVAGCKQFLEWLHNAEEEDDSHDNQEVYSEKLKLCQ